MPKISWITLGVLFSLFLCAPPPDAHANSHVSDEASAQTNRLQLGVAGVMYAKYPLSIEDPGVALQVMKPLWLGERHSYHQWVFNAGLIAGFTVESHHLQLNAHAVFGVDFFFGDFFGLEFSLGPAIFTQLGRDNVFGLGMQGGGGYVFRFWDDDRQRLKLLVNIQAGAYIADDLGNDMGLNAMAMGAGLHYMFAY